MHSGTVVSLVLDRNFGFIFQKSGQPDVFFHAADLCDELQFDATLKERRVQFDLIETNKGPKAQNVRAAD